MSAPSRSSVRKTLKAKRPAAYVPRGSTEPQNAVGGSMPMSRKRQTTAMSQAVPPPSNDVNVRAPASHLEVVVNGSVPAFSQPPLRSRTMSQPVWSPPATIHPETTVPQMTTANHGSSRSVVHTAPQRAASQSVRPSTSTHLQASQTAVDRINATSQPLRTSSMSQSVRAVSTATAVASSTASSRYSVSFVRQPPRSVNVSTQPMRVLTSATTYQPSTGSQLTVVDRGSVRINATNMPLRTMSQSNAATAPSTASSLTYGNSDSVPAFKGPSAAVTSSQHLAASSFASYSQSFGSSQTPTTRMPVVTSSASPLFTSGHANTSNLSPEIANLGIGLAAEPRKSYGWMKVSATTGEQVTLFDEVLSLKIEDMALLYLDGMGPFDKREFEKYTLLPYSPPSLLLKTPTSTKARTRRPLRDIKNRLGTATNGTAVEPQRRSMELMPPPAKCTRLVRT